MPMADAAAPETGKSKAKVFISYSRKDIEFADRLDAALKARGFEPLIDRTDIYAFEEWWTRVEVLITRADTVVFVLSPDAVRPDSVARKEVAFAASLNKRFAPIVYRPVEDKAVPEELAKLNFIFFDDPARFDQSADQLVEALNTDIGWVSTRTLVSTRDAGRRQRAPLDYYCARLCWSRQNDGLHRGHQERLRLPMRRRHSSDRAVRVRRGGGMSSPAALRPVWYWLSP
jgi:hypothetical protein